MTQSLHPYFRLAGEFEPDEISSLLDVQPSAVSRIGDPGIPGALVPRLGAEWIWQPEDDDSDDVGDQLAFLAGALSFKSKEVAELCQKFWGTFHVFNQFNRDWFLSAETLQLIADLRVQIRCEEVSLAYIEEMRANAN